MKAYLAGPMSGRPFYNFPLFIEATEKLRKAGWEIVSPVELDDPEVVEESMNSPTSEVLKGDAEVAGQTWGDLLSRDVKVVSDECDAIVVLPEWEQSRGARLEVFVAMSNNYPVFFYGEGDPVQLDYTRVFNDIREGILV